MAFGAGLFTYDLYLVLVYKPNQNRSLCDSLFPLPWTKSLVEPLKWARLVQVSCSSLLYAPPHRGAPGRHTKSVCGYSQYNGPKTSTLDYMKIIAKHRLPAWYSCPLSGHTIRSLK